MTKPRREAGWLTRAELCRVFDVSPTGFDVSIRPLIPADCIRGEGRNMAYYARGVLDTWRDATANNSRRGNRNAVAEHAGGSDGTVTLMDGTEVPMTADDIQHHHNFLAYIVNATRQGLNLASYWLELKFGAEASKVLVLAITAGRFKLIQQTREEHRDKAFFEAMEPDENARQMVDVADYLKANPKLVAGLMSHEGNTPAKSP